MYGILPAELRLSLPRAIDDDDACPSLGERQWLPAPALRGHVRGSRLGMLLCLDTYMLGRGYKQLDL